MNAIPLPDDFGLRPLRADDAPDIFTAIDTQREHLGRWLPFVAATHRVEQTREVVAAMLADPANPVFTLRLGFRLDRIEVRGEQLADGEFTDLNVYRLPRP